MAQKFDCFLDKRQYKLYIQFDYLTSRDCQQTSMKNANQVSNDKIIYTKISEKSSHYYFKL